MTALLGGRRAGARGSLDFVVVLKVLSLLCPVACRPAGLLACLLLTECRQVMMSRLALAGCMLAMLVAHACSEWLQLPPS